MHLKFQTHDTINTSPFPPGQRNWDCPTQSKDLGRGKWVKAWRYLEMGKNCTGLAL